MTFLDRRLIRCSTSPNKITPPISNGWVQERGLYFANDGTRTTRPCSRRNDPGEPEKPGGELYARYGKGVFIYTGYAWFRQLPAGVPGAYKLFVNLVSREMSDGRELRVGSRDVESRIERIADSRIPTLDSPSPRRTATGAASTRSSSSSSRILIALFYAFTRAFA